MTHKCVATPWLRTATLILDKYLCRYFVIGTVPTTPWAYYKLDSNGAIMKDAEGRPILEGYCVDFAQRLAASMKIDYDLILPTDTYKP